MKRPFDPRAISDPEQVRVLSSPIRQELVDTLASLGGSASIAQIAEELGRPADGLYHHTRKLLAKGLIREGMQPDSNERVYQLASGGDVPLRLAYRPGPEGNAAELEGFVSNLAKIASRDFTDAMRRENIVVDGPQRELWASRNKGWVSDEDLRDINALLERISLLASQPKASGRTRLMSLAFVLAAQDPQPKRRSEPK